ncbi:hypothetical protein K0F50_15300 [Bacteroides fragilis]|nr:hypothetical protein [Bacteroides fragilis]
MDIVALASLLLSAFGIKKQFYSKPKEELEHLKVQFKATQRLSLEVQKGLEKFIKDNNLWEENMFPGVTYKVCLDQMKQFYNEELSDELLNKIEEQDFTKSNIEAITKRLETQFNALSQMNSEFKLKNR